MLNSLDGGRGRCVLWDIHLWVGHNFVRSCVLIFIEIHISWGSLQRLNKQAQPKNFASFEQLAIHNDNLSDHFYVECFISGLKEAINAHVHMQ